jgi:4-hydroxythreonine-4-phosphate dehydrogenase
MVFLPIDLAATISILLISRNFVPVFARTVQLSYHGATRIEGRAMGPLLVLADDLTGAAEAAGAFVGDGRSVRVSLGDESGDADVLAVSTNTRDGSGDAARRGTAAALARHGGDRRLFIKVDSTLRGHVADVLTAVRSRVDDLFVVAPASPEAGRTTVGGAQYVDGAPLADHPTWAVETSPPPPTVADAIGAPGARLASLSNVRATTDELGDTMAATDSVLVCDAENDDDLDRIVAAAESSGRVVHWVGAGGLARAVARAHPSPVPRLPEVESPALIVIGSATTIARSQVERLATTGRIHRHALAPETSAKDRDTAAQVREELARGDVVIHIDAGDMVDRERVGARLAELVAPLVEAVPVTIIGGGDTARRILANTTTSELEVIGPLGSGAVLCRRVGAAGPGFLVLKPGAFGDLDALRTILSTLRPERVSL